MNYKNPAIKRILADVKELERHPSCRYSAAPLEENFFEWHFTIRGPSGSDFDGGIYHGRILLSPEYPFKPPNIVFLTRNGRFETGTKICLSISAYHEESWQPAWGVRTMLEAIISFMPSEGAGAIGALDWTKDERQKLAKESHNFCCSLCGPICKLLSDPKEDEVDAPSKDIADQISQLRFEGKLKSANTSARTDDGERKPPATPISPATLLSSPSFAEDDKAAVRSINFDACDTAVAESSLSQMPGSNYDIASNDFDKPQNSEHDQVSSSNLSTGLPADLSQSYAAPLLVDPQSNIKMLRRRLIGGERISSNNAYASSSSSSTVDVGVSTAVVDTASISSTTVPVPAPVPVVDAAPQLQRDVQIMNLQQLPEDSVDHLLKAILMVLAYFILFLFYKQFTLLQDSDFHMN